MRFIFLRYINRHYLLFSYLIIFLLNIPVLDNQPFGDDFIFVFNYSHITDVNNPLSYYIPWSLYFKSWALSYTFLWTFFQIFGSQFVLYRFVNITLHFINHLIFRKILEKNYSITPTQKNLLSLIFLLHPFAVLTTTWIFQIKTLLSVFFILLFILYLTNCKFNRKKDYLKIISLFWFSILSKSCAILLPIYYVFFKENSFSKKKKWTFISSLLVISLMYGLLNIKGITAHLHENHYLGSFISKVEKVEDTTKQSDIEANQQKYDEIKNTQMAINMDIKVFDEITEGTKAYINPFFNTDNFLGKYSVFIQNLGRLTLYSLGLNSYYPFYENNLKTATNYKLFFFGIIGFICLLALIKLKNHFFYMSFLLFLPISGLFYVPYMKFSFTSDHWFYPSLAFFLLGLTKYIKDKPKIISILGIIIFSNYIFTIYKYRTFPELLKDNYASYENQIIIEHQTHYDKKLAAWDKIAKEYTYLYDNIAPDNTSYGLLISQMGLKLQDSNLINQYYTRNAKIILKTENLEYLQGYNLFHEPFVNHRTRALIESLSAVHSHRLDQQTYLQTINFLK